MKPVNHYQLYMNFPPQNGQLTSLSENQRQKSVPSSGSCAALLTFADDPPVVGTA